MSKNGYVYLFRDSGYDMGMKVGFISSPGCKKAWDAVPSYSPRPMLFEAAWEVPDSFMMKGLSQTANLRRLEKSLHAKCGPLMEFMPEYPRTGKDWCWTAREHAWHVIAEHIGAAPNIIDGHLNVAVTNDNFRNPKPRNVAGNKFKIAVWVYREMHTGRLKTAFVDDWTTPKEKARRYSRNGIEEVAAFSYDGPITPEGNLSILKAWTESVTTFGFGPNDLHYGWLKEDARLDDVVAFYRERLAKLDHNASADNRPRGIRFSYNRAEEPPLEVMKKMQR